MPAAMSTRRSRTGRPSIEATAEPNPDPICVMGPSQPAEPPVPITSAVATALTGGTTGRTLPPRK